MKKIFLSVYRLKSLISLGIVITLLLGISLLYVLVYCFIVSSTTAQIQQQFRNRLVVTFLFTSIFMILSSLSGIYGLTRRKNKFVVIYAITMGVYFCSFLLMGIFISQYHGQISQECNNSEKSDFQITFQAAYNTLCKSCPCYFTERNLYTNQQFAIMNFTSNSDSDSSLPVNAITCEGWSNTTYRSSISFSILESFFKCSGWCQKGANSHLYYLFSNINGGIPEKNCLESVLDFFSQFGRVLLITICLVCSVIFIILIIIICLCLHPDRKLNYDSLQMFKMTLQFVQDWQKVENQKV